MDGDAADLRVLLVTGSYPPMHCGVGDYAERLVSALARDGELQVSVLTSRGKVVAPEQPHVMRDVETWHRRGLDVYRQILQRIQPDVVHIQFPTQGYDFVNGLGSIAIASRCYLNVPVVTTLHEFLPRTARWAYALALASRAIITVRPHYYEQTPWPQKIFLSRSKMHFIENASVVPSVELDPQDREAIKERFGRKGAKLVAFFGFAYPHKGVDRLFEIADPSQHHLLIIGNLDEGDRYHAQLRALADSARWKRKVTLTGFLSPAEVGRLLSAADAVLFPYRNGGGVWNSSLHAAMNQGTFTIATSLQREGYDSSTNVFYARPDDIAGMRQALLTYQGRRLDKGGQVDPWTRIAQQHKEVYASVAKGRRG